MIVIKIDFTPESEAVIREHAKRPQAVLREMGVSFAQALDTTAQSVRMNEVGGTYIPGLRGGTLPVKKRSGALQRAIEAVVDRPLGGYIGALSGRGVDAYAHVILGEQDTIIKPKKAGGHLWVPIADNLNPSGLARKSPREAMSLTDEKGKRRLRIFWSKNQNLVAFLPDPKGGNYVRGRKKGRMRGELLFVLLDQVTVKGTAGLTTGVERNVQMIGDMVHKGLIRGLGEAA